MRTDRRIDRRVMNGIDPTGSGTPSLSGPTRTHGWGGGLFADDLGRRPDGGARDREVLGLADLGRRAGSGSVDGEVQGVVVAGLVDHRYRVAAGREGDGAPDVHALVHAGGPDLEGRLVVVGQLRGAAGDGELGLELRADLEPVAPGVAHDDP